MFRKEFSEVISQTGMIPLKDLRMLMKNEDVNIISELELCSLSFFDDVKFAKNVAQKYNLPFIDLSITRINDNNLKLLKKTDIVKYRVIPIQKTATSVAVITFDPSIKDLTTEIVTVLQHPVEFFIVNIREWQKLFNKVSITIEELLKNIKEVIPDSQADQELIKEEDIGEEIIYYVNKFLAESYIRKASDIHIEPYENNFRIRFRIDGSLIECFRPPIHLKNAIISRVKIMAQMDIAERRKPQDGRIKLMIGSDPIDYRVSCLPTLFGEKMVLRLLDSTSLELDMTKLGFEKKQLEIFKQGIYRPYGMCLVTGPTGSGKTTTLYSAISDLNKIDTNISTAEDPVEFNLQGINQVNVRKDIGLTFAAALKAFLRQDPDVIMVGEIRDFETGEIAIEAALTGHLVLSTLHTNDAPSTITRLLNMGIEPFLVTGALNVVVAQRLCRRICKNCAEPDNQTKKEEIIACGVAPASAERIQLFRGKGCNVCNGTGYKGRVAIYEVLPMSPIIRELVLRNASADEIKKQAVAEGMKTLRMSALTKVAQGMTTLEEAVSNSSSDKF